MSDGIKQESSTYGNKKHRKMIYSRKEKCLIADTGMTVRSPLDVSGYGTDGVGSDRIGRAGSLT